MPDYIGWYVVDLRMRLQGRLPEERVEIIASEVESHLRESSLRIEEAQPQNSELAAIRVFGKPENVALGYLREADPRMWGLKPLWIVLCSGLLSIGCWVFNWISLHGYFDNYGATWQNGLATMIGLCALILFTGACRAGYRSYFKQIFALSFGTAVGLVFLLSFWIVGSKDGFQGLSRIHLSRDVRTVQRHLSRLETLATYFKEGAAAYSVAKSAADLPLQYRNPRVAERMLGYPERSLYGAGWVDNWAPTLPIPANYISAYVDGRLWGLYLENDFAKAKALWTVGTERRLARIADEKDGLTGLLASAEEARSGRLFFFNPGVYQEAVIWSILFLPALLILDALAFRIRRAPSWPAKAIA